MTARIELITDVLVQHQRVKSECLCGYVYKLGESFMVHRAEAVDAALTAAGFTHA